ncbi:OTUD3 protein, partial [Alcedo cyanopectus]|nr:OTUD3 protein [Ceyx cyanopectus]
AAQARCGPAGMSRRAAAQARGAAGTRKGRRPRQTPPVPAPDPAPAGGGLARQLRALGLKLREVPGDGNCLFRALGDQLEGHSRNHLRHRQETVEFMLQRREDFEPFVEDDVPFDKHVANLAKPGTFAGNDAIVAFARNNQLNVVIHQLNAPLWQIQGTEKQGRVRELHVAYRHGQHYDSVRSQGDDAEAPACLQMEMLCQPKLREELRGKPWKGDSEEEAEAGREDVIQKVCRATGCSDMDLISQILQVEDYNIESAIFAVSQVIQVESIGAEEPSDSQSREQESCSRTVQEEDRSGSRLSGSQSLHPGETESSQGQARPSEEPRAGRKTKASKKQKKDQQRLEKKKRQEERHRQKVLATKSNCAGGSSRELDSSNHITLVKAMEALNI